MITRITPIEITAAGMDADTVIPTLSPKYAFAAPNTIANNTPIITDVTVNSGVTFSAGTYGLNSSFISFLQSFITSNLFLCIAFHTKSHFNQTLILYRISSFRTTHIFWIHNIRRTQIRLQNFLACVRYSI